MKIAIFVNELNVLGGTHKQILRLAQFLTNQGHEPVIITRYYDIEKTYPEFKDMQVEYLYKDFVDFNSMPKPKGILKKIKKKFENKILSTRDAFLLAQRVPKDCDIVNLHANSIYATILFLKFWFNSKAKFVWQINDLPGCFRVGVFVDEPDSKRKDLNRRAIRFISKFVDEITVNVTKNAERVKQCFGRDAKVFYCGVDVNDKLQKHSYNIKDNTVRILSSGVFFPYRNYESLIGVIENLKNKNINVHLDVIGSTEFDKEYSEKIKNLVKEKQLENEITIWGQVDDEKYVELHNQADMFAFININQSWGLAVFEAMSCGLPVIVSESVGAIELLHHNEDAIIVDPENVNEVSDVVLKLMNDKEYYNKISENAFNAVKEFTWDKLYSEKMLGLFEELTK